MKKIIIFLLLFMIFSCSKKSALFIEDDFYNITKENQYNVSKVLKRSLKKSGVSFDKYVLPIEGEDKLDLSVFISENLKYDIFILSPIYEKFVYQYAQDNPDKIFVPLETIKNYSYSNIIPVILSCTKGYSDLGSLFAKLNGYQLDKPLKKDDKKSSTKNDEEIDLDSIPQEVEKLTIKAAAVVYNSSKRRDDEWTSFKQSFDNFKTENSTELFVYEISNSTEPNLEERVKDTLVNNNCNLILLYGASFNSRLVEVLTGENLYLATELWSKGLSNDYNNNIYYTIEYDYKSAFDELSNLIQNQDEGFKQVFLEGKIKKIKKHSTLYNIIVDK